MVDPIGFLLAALILLAAPGPTNTLLAMSGAAAGLRPSLPLIAAALGGYLLSILLLALVLGALVRDNPAVDVALKLACAAFLVWLAIKLWREGSRALVSAQPVRIGRVFTATLLNPKAVIFAFVIIPHLARGRPLAALPYLAGFCLLALAVGGAWTGLGAALRAGAGGRPVGGWMNRLGATALMVFACVLGGSAWSAAAAMAG